MHWTDNNQQTLLATILKMSDTDSDATTMGADFPQVRILTLSRIWGTRLLTHT